MIAEKINISDKFGKLPAGDYAVGVIAKGVPNTGDVQNEMTIAKVEWV